MTIMANRLIDLTGVRFTNLVVCSLFEKRGIRKVIHWLCECDCGNHHIASGDNLKSGKVKSCGCLRKIPPNKQCLIGQKFQRLLVLNYAEKKTKSTRYLCLCDCGQYKEVDHSELKKLTTRSCGCLAKELASLRRKNNQFGSKNASYNPLLTSKDRIDRRISKNHREWSLKVKQKHNFTCVFCYDDTGHNLVSHHMYGYADYPKLRFDIDNGVCLCENCHKDFHKTCGNKHNTKEQFLEWLSDDIL